MSVGKSFVPQLSRDELELRASLLGKNKRLQQLHTELVLPGHVSEEEFWESRRVSFLESTKKYPLPNIFGLFRIFSRFLINMVFNQSNAADCLVQFSLPFVQPKIYQEILFV